MNRKIIFALLTSAMLLTACGKAEDNEKFSVPDADISEEERPTFAPKEKETEAADDHRYDPSDGDDMMELELKKHSMDADADGFKIVNGVLYDYEGDSSEVHIPEGVTRIETHACWSNDTIKALYIPSSVEEIGEGAFWGCSGLEYVKAEEGLKKIGSSAFWSCSSLTTVELPASVEEIPFDVFWAIDGLTIHAPEGSYTQKFAEEMEFGFSTSGTEYVANTDKTISAGEYRYGDFEEFTIPEDVKGIDAEGFQYCENLKSIVIPANVSYIGSNAFEYCDSLKFVYIVSCGEIKAEAFEYCENLTSVKIGEGCEKIGSSAFAYCKSLNEVYLPNSVQSISERAFEYCSPDLILHVPSGSYAEEFAQETGISYDNNMR